ncbi:hypothetical protein KI387_036105, partial [Taxus chinensis]
VSQGVVTTGRSMVSNLSVPPILSIGCEVCNVLNVLVSQVEVSLVQVSQFEVSSMNVVSHTPAQTNVNAVSQMITLVFICAPSFPSAHPSTSSTQLPITTTPAISITQDESSGHEAHMTLQKFVPRKIPLKKNRGEQSGTYFVSGLFFQIPQCMPFVNWDRPAPPPVVHIPRASLLPQSQMPSLFLPSVTVASSPMISVESTATS